MKEPSVRLSGEYDLGVHSDLGRDMDANGLLANRLALAARDMHVASQYLDAFEELVQEQSERGTSEFFFHCQAIMVAAIVTYCRSFQHSFSQGNADNKIDLASNPIFDGEPALLTLHDRLIERRDKAIAHADWEYHKTVLVSSDYKGGTLRQNPTPDLTGAIDATEFRELLDHVLAWTMRRLFDLDRGLGQPLQP
jgi:hypothetical protein